MKTGFLTKIILFTGLVILMASCLVPTTKDSYLKKFEDFVTQVEEEHEAYNKKDWKWADNQFRKFNEDWYDEYKNELSLAEKVKVKMIVLKYKTIKSEEAVSSEIREKLKEDIKEDAEEIKDRINEYLENDADEDLEKLKEGLEEIGDSAVKVFEDILDNIKNKE